MEKVISEYDCSDIIPNLDSIRYLNRHFQIKGLPDLEFQHQQLGQSHAAIFDTKTNFEACLFFAKSRTKKDSEKKIKTHVWYLISEGILSLEDNLRKKVKAEEPKSLFSPFSKFKEILSTKFTDFNQPILILDLENCGNKVLNNAQFKEICTNHNIGLISITTRHVPENEGEILVLKREDMHKDSADEGIRRILYYLTDHLNFNKVGLITMDHFGQSLKDIYFETQEEFVLFKDLEEFLLKFPQLVGSNTKISPNNPASPTQEINNHNENIQKEDVKEETKTSSKETQTDEAKKGSTNDSETNTIESTQGT